MCLFTLQNKISKADKDIECWKILESIEDRTGNKIYITPYQCKVVGESYLLGKEMLIPDHFPYIGTIEETLRRHDSKNSIEIRGGFIHVFDTLHNECMYNEVKYLSGYIGAREKIEEHYAKKINCNTLAKIISVALFRCVIPSGFGYIKGKCMGANGLNERPDIGTRRDSYAARAIYFKEKVFETTSSKFDLETFKKAYK